VGLRLLRLAAYAVEDDRGTAAEDRCATKGRRAKVSCTHDRLYRSNLLEKVLSNHRRSLLKANPPTSAFV
jgi:hypothetical protein